MTSRTSNRSEEPDRQQVSIAARRGQTKADPSRTLVVSTGGLVAVGAVVAVMMLASSPASSAMPASPPAPTMASSMPGMDHGSMPPSSPSPAMADMPGMDHGFGAMPTSSPSPAMAAGMPGMDHSHAPEAAQNRPLAAVLGTFGGGTSAVLLSAGFLRRKDLARSQAKSAVRAARRIQK